MPEEPNGREEISTDGYYDVISIIIFFFSLNYKSCDCIVKGNGSFEPTEYVYHLARGDKRNAPLAEKSRGPLKGEKISIFTKSEIKCSDPPGALFPTILVSCAYGRLRVGGKVELVFFFIYFFTDV